MADLAMETREECHRPCRLIAVKTFDEKSESMVDRSVNCFPDLMYNHQVHPIDLADDEPVSNPEMAHERPHRHRRTTTLDPRRLTASDWLDCSGLIEPVHEVKPGVASRAVSTRIRYFYNHPRRIPFPSDARGFLYYHPPNSNILSPEHDEFNVGHIRFRCATSPETFQEGKDLLLPTKAPWHYAGSHRLGRNHPLWTLARQEGLVTEEAVATYSANRAHLRQFEQPFIVNLAHHGHTICYADKEENVKRFFCITTLLRVHKSKTVEDTRNLPPSYFTNGKYPRHMGQLKAEVDSGRSDRLSLRGAVAGRSRQTSDGWLAH